MGNLVILTDLLKIESHPDSEFIKFVALIMNWAIYKLPDIGFNKTLNSLLHLTVMTYSLFIIIQQTEENKLDYHLCLCIV